MVMLFAGAIGPSALLLFWVQPMFARMALPLLGGSPSVWNTALVFFQGALLAGYGYAHLIARLPLRAQACLHALVPALGAAALPIAVPDGWSPPGEGAPTGWLLALLAVAPGPPFFALSATSPLLQAWFARSGHADARDPFFCMRRAARRTAPAPMAEQTTGAGATCWRDRLWWIALAFAPSSLLLGVTQHVTSDVAAILLFWVVPLSLYLATFILAFARRSLHRVLQDTKTGHLVLMHGATKLAPGGVILAQISNWHLDLEPVAARLAADAGLAARVQHYSPAEPDKAFAEYRFPTSWTAFARAEKDLGRLAADPRWRSPALDPADEAWTDDYANLIGALRWTRPKQAL